jgi:hypothetical protein
MCTYTKMLGGGCRSSAATVTHGSVRSAELVGTAWVPHPSLSRVRFFQAWPRRRNGARAKGVHGPTLRYEEWGTQKGKETAAGLKSPALHLNRNAFLRRRKLILRVDVRRGSDGLRHEPTLNYKG